MISNVDIGLAFIMGLGGSIHCLGMCGPIVLSLPFHQETKAVKVSRAITYNLGRVLGYSLFGLIPGILGRLFYLGGLQSILSVSLGSLIIMGVLGLYLRSSFQSIAFMRSIDGWIQTLMRKVLRAGQQKHYLHIGFVNAFIPCGMVYIALAGAMTQSTVFASILYMAAFGLGTVPLMLLLCLSVNLVKAKTRTRLRRFVPYFMCLLGVVLILRGLEINLPEGMQN